MGSREGDHIPGRGGVQQHFIVGVGNEHGLAADLTVVLKVSSDRDPSWRALRMGSSPLPARGTHVSRCVAQAVASFSWTPLSLARNCRCRV